MRIVHVTRQFPPSQGGMEAFVESLARCQSSGGSFVRVITLDHVFEFDQGLPSKVASGDVEVFRIPFHGSGRYAIAPALLKHIKDADIVHVHGMDFLFFLAATSLFHRKRLIVSTHGAFSCPRFADYSKIFYFNVITRINLSCYSFVAASSQSDLDLVYKIRRRGLGLVSNGVDTSRFAGIVGNDRIKKAIYFGPLTGHKNIDALIPMLAALRECDPDWKLVVAGRPTDRVANELREVASRWSLSSAVEIIVSPTDQQLRHEIASSSVFCSASSYEDCGTAAIEALSAGLLPVLSDIPAHRHTLAAVGCGILADFADPTATARHLLDEWSGSAPMLDKDRLKKALDVYAWDAVAARFDELYGNVLGNTKRLILSTNVDVFDTDDAVQTIAVASARRAPLRIAFVNAHLANIAARHADFAKTLESFCLLNDGIGVDIASFALYGKSFPKNLNGTDFTPLLLDRLRAGQRLYLLGATQKVIETTARFYEKRWPQHEIVGFSHGFFSDHEEVELASIIRRATPDIILVGMGSPRQETWLARHIPEVCPVGLAVGALFDFQSDAMPRAPEIVRKAKIEWVFRLMVEPRRLWRRYLVGNVVFLQHLALQWFRGDRA